MWIIETFANFLFPSSCILCREGTKSLCLSCSESLTKNITTLPEDTHALLSYQDKRVRLLIQSGKYKKRKEIIQILANILYTNKKHYFTKYHISKTILIPMPMPKIREYARGYNQAEICVKELSKLSGIPYVSTIIARHSIKRQAIQKNRVSRLLNPVGSFFLKGSASNLLTGMNVLLIDDIITTGATCKEAKKILNEAGVASVTTICLAH